jgi:hypothetical protein
MEKSGCGGRDNKEVIWESVQEPESKFSFLYSGKSIQMNRWTHVPQYLLTIYYFTWTPARETGVDYFWAERTLRGHLLLSSYETLTWLSTSISSSIEQGSYHLSLVILSQGYDYSIDVRHLAQVSPKFNSHQNNSYHLEGLNCVLCVLCAVY